MYGSVQSLRRYCRKFYRVLKSRVENYFKENNIVSPQAYIGFESPWYAYYTDCDTQDPKIDYWMFLRYVVLFIIANLGWFGVVCVAAVNVEIDFTLLVPFPDLVP